MDMPVFAFATSVVSIVTAVTSIVTASVLAFVVLRIGRPAVKQMMKENDEARDNRSRIRLQIIDLQRYQETLLHTFKKADVHPPHDVTPPTGPETSQDLQRYQQALVKALDTNDLDVPTQEISHI